MKPFTVFLFSVFYIFILSCSNLEVENISSSDSEQLNIIKKIQDASSNLLLVESFEDSLCGINVGPNCFQFSQTITLELDLTECSTNISGLCDVSGTMEVVICQDNFGQNLEVNFSEYVFSHARDCITGNPHTDDWDCIADKFYSSYVNYMMPLILDWWGEKSNCGNGYNAAISNYFKNMCVFPCSYEEGDFIFYEIIQCGQSTACCVKKQYWCKDQNGEIQITSGGNVQIGLCSEGPIPCNNYIDFPFKNPDCFPRNCIEETIPQ
ncbi:MAG: hypothetical protein R2879_10820 [Saprospiraceae bacterium]